MKIKKVLFLITCFLALIFISASVNSTIAENPDNIDLLTTSTSFVFIHIDEIEDFENFDELQATLNYENCQSTMTGCDLDPTDCGGCGSGNTTCCQVGSERCMFWLVHDQ